MYVMCFCCRNCRSFSSRNHHRGKVFPGASIYEWYLTLTYITLCNYFTQNNTINSVQRVEPPEKVEEAFPEENACVSVY